MTEALLTIGCALLAFGPTAALFALLISKKAQLVIVVTTAAFFFLVGATGASAAWTVFHTIGLNGPLAAIIPGVFLQFISRCYFVTIYHRVEQVIKVTLHKQNEQEILKQRHEHPPVVHNAAQQQQTGDDNDDDHQESNGASISDATIRGLPWMEQAKLRLQLNDAACGVAAGVGFGGMHAVMLYGTLLASQSTNNVGILYQDSCPAIPSLVVSAVFAFCFSILDVFWMLFTFFGMRRRALYSRGQNVDDLLGVDLTPSTHPHSGRRRAIGGWFGNTRNGGNVALLFTLASHYAASILTTSNYFKLGCTVSMAGVGVIVLLTAYFFWAGIGRIYMPPAQAVTVTNSMS